MQVPTCVAGFAVFKRDLNCQGDVVLKNVHIVGEKKVSEGSRDSAHDNFGWLHLNREQPRALPLAQISASDSDRANLTSDSDHANLDIY